MVLPPACSVTSDISCPLNLLGCFWWKEKDSLKLTQAGEIGIENNYKNAGVTQRTQVGMQPVLRKRLEVGARTF